MPYFVFYGILIHAFSKKIVVLGYASLPSHLFLCASTDQLTSSIHSKLPDQTSWQVDKNQAIIQMKKPAFRQRK